MSQPQFPYNNPPVAPMPPQMPPKIPPQMPPPPYMRPQNKAARWFGFNMQTTTGIIQMPKWLYSSGLLVYFLSLAVVTVMYSSYALPWYYLVSGIVSVVVFWAYGMTLVKDLSVPKMLSEKRFEKRIFLTALAIRLTWMLLIYMIFKSTYGDEFGFEKGDAAYYRDLGEFVAQLIQNGNFNFYDEIAEFSGNNDIADMGYGIYMGFIYTLTGNSILAVRIIKCVLSAFTVIFMYRLAKRNFGPYVARLTAIFITLWPNFWYYCGCHLKETEMVFLVVLFIEQADQMLRSRQFTAWKVIPVLLIGLALFTFRTVLGLVALLALLFTIVMSSTRVVNWGKRIIIGLLAVALIAVTAGNRIAEKSRVMWETATVKKEQQGNMEWRSKRKGGNSFAKYASATVFAPLIFTIPFPTMASANAEQNTQQLLNGGNYLKNILSFFTIISMIALLLTGKWRDHLLPVSLLLGYLVVLTVSSFPHAERFHQPVMPFEMMFIAYGISIVAGNKRYRRWFNYWSILIFVICVAWNWFKLKGRGMV